MHKHKHHQKQHAHIRGLKVAQGIWTKDSNHSSAIGASGARVLLGGGENKIGRENTKLRLVHPNKVFNWSSRDEQVLRNTVNTNPDYANCFCFCAPTDFFPLNNEMNSCTHSKKSQLFHSLSIGLELHAQSTALCPNWYSALASINVLPLSERHD